MIASGLTAKRNIYRGFKRYYEIIDKRRHAGQRGKVVPWLGCLGEWFDIRHSPRQFYFGSEHFDKVVDASGCYVLPGVIDDHVHFVSLALRQRPT